MLNSSQPFNVHCSFASLLRCFIFTPIHVVASFSCCAHSWQRQLWCKQTSLLWHKQIAPVLCVIAILHFPHLKLKTPDYTRLWHHNALDTPDCILLWHHASTDWHQSFFSRVKSIVIGCSVRNMMRPVTNILTRFEVSWRSRKMRSLKRIKSDFPVNVTYCSEVSNKCFCLIQINFFLSHLHSCFPNLTISTCATKHINHVWAAGGGGPISVEPCLKGLRTNKKPFSSQASRHVIVHDLETELHAHFHWMWNWLWKKLNQVEMVLWATRCTEYRNVKYSINVFFYQCIGLQIWGKA